MMLEDFDLGRITEPLLEWYAGHARTLPWRSEPTPYRVWVSEIMLQQTRVEAVKPYYERFLAALPDHHALAACPQDRLMKLWEGLGYYSRARNLQAAARQIEEEYGGEIPSEYEELLKLKGVGRYTAGAVASIAFGRRAAAVDGNVLRVITRLCADGSDIMKDPFRRSAERRLAAVMPEGRCGEFNQALMELGATVCVPKGEPQCGNCPWEGICLAHQAGQETRYPVKPGPRPRRIEERTVLLICDSDRIVLRRRPEKGLLAGLYEFPSVPGHIREEEALEEVRRLGFLPLRIRSLEYAKHIFSHVEWHMRGYLVRVGEPDAAPEGLVLADRSRIERDYAVPAAFAAYTEAVQVRLGIKEEGKPS